ncbi:hypothetical protein MRX96_031031 [Rhipicephalus microplus]
MHNQISRRSVCAQHAVRRPISPRTNKQTKRQAAALITRRARAAAAGKQARLEAKARPPQTRGSGLFPRPATPPSGLAVVKNVQTRRKDVRVKATDAWPKHGDRETIKNKTGSLAATSAVE